jgi:hypothetical protein
MASRKKNTIFTKNFLNNNIIFNKVGFLGNISSYKMIPGNELGQNLGQEQSYVRKGKRNNMLFILKVNFSIYKLNNKLISKGKNAKIFLHLFNFVIYFFKLINNY